MKSHFEFSKKERSGIFLLILLVVGLLSFLFFVDFNQDNIIINKEELQVFQKEIDSLRQIEIEKRKPKIFPFNPNFISDHKGYVLGMSNEEIDRLFEFREKGLWINSTSQFQEVTKVSDSLLASISTYFKFPEWVTNPKTKTNTYQPKYSNRAIAKRYDQKIDLNKATALQLQKVYGIGAKLSERIIKYRSKTDGGFIDDIELTEIYGLDLEVIDRIKKDFTVKTPRTINKINLNTATRDQLVTIKYIDYEIAKHIIETRTLRDGFNSLDELTKVQDFPNHKIEIIKLYLQLQ